MICPDCGSHMVEVKRKIAWQCLYSPCPHYKQIYYPFLMVASKNDQRVVHCPICRTYSVFEDVVEEDGLAGIHCPRCGYLAWPYWVDNES